MPTMPTGKPSAKYVRFSEEANAVDYVEKAYGALRRVARRTDGWKWVVIALHGALYGFAVCALHGSNWQRVTAGPKRRLISFDEALKRCGKTEYMTFFVHSKTLQLTADQKDSLRFLKQIRNQIEHYVPILWSIELHSLALSAVDAIDVIRFLALESGNVRLDPHQYEQADGCTSKARRLLQESQLYKDHIAVTRRLARSALR
jgi:hypothetical protein